MLKVTTGTLGLDNFPLELRFLVVGLYRLTVTDPPGDKPGCGRDKVRNETALT